MKHKKLFTAVTAVVSVLIALSIFLMLWFWGDAYKGGPNSEGFEDFRREFEIPGLSDGACPQGHLRGKIHRNGQRRERDKKRTELLFYQLLF